MDKTFVKGLKLLELLATSQDARGVTDLAQEMGLTKSNVHRLLVTLSSEGFARRLDRGKYQLTSKIWELGILVRGRMALVQIAGPHLANLAAATEESVHLSILDGDEVVYLDKVESPHPIAAYTKIGGRAPARCVATGKAMLAYGGWGDRIGDAEFPAFTPTTITSRAALDQDLAATRQRGYAVNRGEWRAQVVGIASPIRDATGEVVGALGISGPENRFDAVQIERWGELVRLEAARVSAILGHRDALEPVHEKSTRNDAHV